MTQTTTVTHESPEWVMMAKALRGELSDREQKEFTAWLSADDHNTQQWADAMEAWNEVGSQADFSFTPDIDAAWEKISQKMEFSAPILPITSFASSSVEEVETAAGFAWNTFYRYAAAVIVAAGLSWVGYNNLNTADEWTQVATLTGERKVIYLPDSSQVTLNAHSTLRYQTAFNGSERNVKLTGEAFFDVRRNPEKPFVIESGDAKTRVLGTSFNVKSISGQQVKVSVSTGKVSLSSITSKKEIILTPGLTGTLKQGEVSKDSTADASPTSWRALSFQDETLQQVVSDINAYFNVNLTIKDKALTSCTFTGTFEKPNLKDVLKVLVASSDLQITTTNQREYILSGRGCS